MTGREFTMKYEFKNVGELKDDGNCFHSPEEKHFGVEWKVGLDKWADRCIVWLEAKKTRNQEIHVGYTTKIFSRNREKTRSKSGRGVFRGCALFTDWKTMEEEYMNDGKLDVEFHVEITKMIGFRDELRSFGEDMKQFSDVALVVEDRKFHVSKLYLSSQSPYFATLFLGQFQESMKSEIELKDVKAEDLQFYLEVMYAEDGIDDDTVEGILQIADMYETPLAIKKCENYLIEKSKMELIKKFDLAKEYKLEELTKVCWESV
ncbi:unnamed protein product [Caenorhabditis nigoni]